MSDKAQRLVFVLVNWCDEFQLGVEGTITCDNGKDKVFSGDKLEEAKSYCDEKNECIGVMRHPDGNLTPRCGNMVETGVAHWLNKRGCLSGSQPP